MDLKEPKTPDDWLARNVFEQHKQDTMSAFGGPRQKQKMEGFIDKYGYEHGIKVLDEMLEGVHQNRLRNPGDGDYLNKQMEELEKYKDSILKRLTS